MQITTRQRTFLVSVFAELTTSQRGKRLGHLEHLFLCCADDVRIHDEENAVSIVLNTLEAGGIHLPAFLQEHGAAVVATMVEGADRDELADSILEIVQSSKEAVEFLRGCEP